MYCKRKRGGKDVKRQQGSGESGRIRELVNNNRRPLPLFFGSVHSKRIKVFCFEVLTEVFILNDLLGQNCTKIVQVAANFVCVAKKRVRC